MSYGSDEVEMTVAYAVRQCNEYGKLGMLGMTVLYSSGGKLFPHASFEYSETGCSL